MRYTYLDCLAVFGIGGAHPGGLQITQKILSKEKIEAGMTVLDAGCGTGQTSAYVAKEYGCNVIAIDVNSLMIKKAKDRMLLLDLPIKVEEGDVQNLKFEDDSFDMILSESVVAFTDPDLTITEFNRVLKVDGRLIAIEMVVEQPLEAEEIEEISNFYGVSRLFTKNEWVSIFHKAGFTVNSIELPNIQFSNSDKRYATDFSLSESIDEEFHDIFKRHESLLALYKEKLGFRLFRCSK